MRLLAEYDVGHTNTKEGPEWAAGVTVAAGTCSVYVAGKDLKVSLLAHHYMD